MTKARGDQPDRSEDLSEAARAVVRDAGDPRIDAHLAALGLGPDPAPEAPASRPVQPVQAAPDPELAALRLQVAELEAALATARRRVGLLLTAMTAVLVGSVVVILLLLSRPA